MPLYVISIRAFFMTVLKESALNLSQVNRQSNSPTDARFNEVTANRFVGNVVGNATTATQLQNNFSVTFRGDATGQFESKGVGGHVVDIKVNEAEHSKSADFTAQAQFAEHTTLADLANLATHALTADKSGNATEASHSAKSSLADNSLHADKASVADIAHNLSWDMITTCTEYPLTIAKGVLYIRVRDENGQGEWEIIGFKYMDKNDLIHETDLTLYRIRFTNRALTEDFLEHRRIWATPSPERTLSNIKGEIEQINVAENDTAIEKLDKREAKFFKQEDLL